MSLITWIKYAEESADEVTPSRNNVSSLKEAVKAKMPNTLKDIDACKLRVKDHMGNLLENDATLQANTRTHHTSSS